MGKAFKNFLKVTVGVGAAAGAAYAAYKAKCEMDAMPSETGKGTDKTKKWLKMKKDALLEIDLKNEQINQITAALKAKLLEEQNVEKRRELMDKASEQIRTLKAEIKDLMHKRAKELAVVAHNIPYRELTEELTSLVGGAGKSIKEKLDPSDEASCGDADCADDCDECCEDTAGYSLDDALNPPADEYCEDLEADEAVTAKNEPPIIFEGE